MCLLPDMGWGLYIQGGPKVGIQYAIRTGSLYIILHSAHTVYLCVLCGSENKQRLFPYTTLTDCFL